MVRVDQGEDEGAWTTQAGDWVGDALAAGVLPKELSRRELLLTELLASSHLITPTAQQGSFRYRPFTEIKIRTSNDLPKFTQLQKCRHGFRPKFISL